MSIKIRLPLPLIWVQFPKACDGTAQAVASLCPGGWCPRRVCNSDNAAAYDESAGDNSLMPLLPPSPLSEAAVAASGSNHGIRGTA